MDVVLIIVVITAGCSWVAFNNPTLINQLSFQPFMVSAHRQWYRFFSCALIHADLPHLAVNMLVFYSFGQVVMYYFNGWMGQSAIFHFLALYVLGVGFANLSTFYKYRHSSFYKSVGASGGVSAVLFASVLFAPWSKVLLFFILPLPSIVAAGGYLVYSWYMARKASGDNINHEAHFLGAIFGLTYPILIKPEIGKVFLEALVNRL